MQIPRHWRLRDQRYNLKGTICTRCGKVSFTPRPVCTECSAPIDLHDETFSEQRVMHHVMAAEPAQR